MLKRLASLFRGNVPPRPAAAPQEDVEALIAPAKRAITEGRVDDAISLLETLVEDHPRCAEAHLMLGTVLHQRKHVDDARDHYLLAAAYRPAWSAPQFHLGVLSCDAGRYADGTASFVRALELGPREARVHDALGAAYLNSGQSAEAVAEFRKALEVAPDFAQAHSNLGLALMRDLEQYEEGTRHIERAMALAPDDPAVLCNWMMALHHWGRRGEALSLAQTLLARDPALIEARMNRALMLLGEGVLGEAWDDYEARRSLPGSTCAHDVPSPEWQGSALAGRSIFVYPEQGLGDEIMFASCIPDLVAQGARCTLECHPKLEKIFRRSFPGVEVLAKDDWRRLPQSAPRSWDFKVAIGSLPRFVRRTPAGFPAHAGYLRADPARVAHWKARLAELPGRLKVGVSWRGGLASTRRSVRSIPLASWLPVLALPEIDLVSLQYADAQGEIDALRRGGHRAPHHWSEALGDYDETAALVSALDLVVSVQTAVVHLAGALGEEVWALIPVAPEWRYGAEGGTMPWYPAVKLLRQTGSDDWTAVIERVRNDLAARARQKATVT
jgi:Flp pilus assembly protein TadD